MGNSIRRGRSTLAGATTAASVVLATATCARAPGGFEPSPGQTVTGGADASGGDAPAGSLFGGADAACPSLPPVPTGSQCTCAWTDCKADELLCRCAPDCYEQSPDCLITVGEGGVSTTSNAFLSSCTIDCVYEPGIESEFSTMGQLVCRAFDCHDPSQPGDGASPPAATDGQAPPPGPTSCPVPVPGPTTITVWIAGITGFKFKIPFSDWALATAHVWHKLPELYPAHIDLRPSPSFFFATGMVETFWGCSLRLPPFDPANAGQYFMQWVQPLLPDGCLAITLGASQELQMLFPEVYDGVNVTHDSVVSSVNQVALGRDDIVSSVLTKAYVDLVNYALLVEQGAPDPDAWFAAASDPWAKVEMIAQMYNQGPYNPDVQRVMTQCQNVPLQSCIVEGIQYVKEVTTATQNLEASVAAGNCYDDPIGHDDITYYLDRVFPLYANEDQQAITSAALAAFDQAAGGQAKAPFQQVALPVLDAIDGAMKSKLYCPEAKLSQLWQKHCPQ